MLGLVSIPKVNFLFSSLHSLLRPRSYTHPFSLARTTDSVRACVSAEPRHLRTPAVKLRVIQPTRRCILIRAILLVTFLLKKSDKK